MAAKNKGALGTVPGVLYVGLYDASIPSLDNDNQNADTVANYIDWNIDFVEMASLIDLQRSQDLTDNLTEVETDDRWTIYKASQPRIAISGSWYETGELDVIERMLGIQSKTVAGTSTNVPSEELSSSGVLAGDIYVLDYKNGDDSQVTVNDVAADWTSLVEWTDYTLDVNEDGETRVVFLTDNAGVITVDYDYIPNEKKYTGMTVESMEIPQLVIKIVSADSSGTNTEYLIDAGFEGELIQAYINPSRTNDLTASSFEFVGNKQGSYIFEAERGIN